MPLWGDIMAGSRSQSLTLLPVEDIEAVRVDLASGLQVDARCANGREMPFVKGSAPRKLSGCEAAPRVAQATGDAPSEATGEPHAGAAKAEEKPAAEAPTQESGGSVSKFLRSIFKW
jgi:hypothetical protein